MTALADATLRSLVMTGALGVSPMRPEAIQPASVDLHLGPTLRVQEWGTIADPETDQAGTWRDVDPNAKGRWQIGGHRLYLGSTTERVRIPDDCAGLLSGISSLGRHGLLVHVTAGFIDPGFCGELTLELVVLTQGMMLRPGQRIAQLTLIHLDQPSERPYGHPSRASKYQRDAGPVTSRSHLDQRLTNDLDKLAYGRAHAGQIGGAVVIEGFCTLELQNVPIGSNRRCLTDQTFAIAPSTLCAHRTFTSNGWSACTQERPCPPRGVDDWRAILSQQAKAVQKRDQDRAARQFMAATPKPPKLATAHKTAATTSRPRCRTLSPRPCARCGQQFQPRTAKRKFCGVGCSHGLDSPTTGASAPHSSLQPIPCLICGTPFRPLSLGAGRGRRKTCSKPCGAKLGAQTIREQRQEVAS